MKTITLYASEIQIETKTNHFTYQTGIDAAPGFILMNDSSGSYDLVIVNQIHNGGLVTVKMKPVRIPAKKYEVGDVIGTLVVLE